MDMLLVEEDWTDFRYVMHASMTGLRHLAAPSVRETTQRGNHRWTTGTHYISSGKTKTAFGYLRKSAKTSDHISTLRSAEGLNVTGINRNSDYFNSAYIREMFVRSQRATCKVASDF